MPGQPLQLTSPNFLSYLPAGISADMLVTWVLYAVFAFWAVYTLIAIYHWLKYSHASWVASPAIALHLAVSIAIMSYALSGNGLFLSPFLP